MEDDKLICMICGLSPEPDEFGYGPPIEEEEDGDWCVYCRSCDCWTSHPAAEQEGDK